MRLRQPGNKASSSQNPPRDSNISSFSKVTFLILWALYFLFFSTSLDRNVYNDLGINFTGSKLYPLIPRKTFSENFIKIRS